MAHSNKLKARRDLHEEITGKIIKELENGTVPWLKPWAGGTSVAFAGFGAPRNAISKRRYSGINVLLLWMESDEKGYTSNEWLTYKQAQSRGGHVRAGEKGTGIIYAAKIERLEKNKETGDFEKKEIFMLKSFTVFNTEQCENLNFRPKPVVVVAPVEPVVGGATEDGLDEKFAAAVKETGAKVRHGGNQAYYQRGTDHIQMPKVADFVSCANYQATLAHELIHWTGHQTRLDRLGAITTTRQSEGYAFEELVAELGAAFTCAEFGIKGDLRHAGYIQSWIKLLKEDKKALFKAASKASKAVAFLYPDSDAGEEAAEAEGELAA